MSHCFKNTEDRFSGNTLEDITEYFKMYEAYSYGYKLNPTLQLQYFPNLSDGEAKRYYRGKVTTMKAVYDEAKQIMIEHYNNVKTQNRTRKYLQKMTLSSVIDKENC